MAFDYVSFGEGTDGEPYVVYGGAVRCFALKGHKISCPRLFASTVFSRQTLGATVSVKEKTCKMCGKGLHAGATHEICVDCEYKAERRTSTWMAVLVTAVIASLLAVFIMNSRSW